MNPTLELRRSAGRLGGAAKQRLYGTSLEAPARWLNSELRRFSRRYRRTRQYERETVQVMRAVIAADSNCIDIGCYRGLVLREMLRLAPNGRHLAFEPLPDQAQRLVEAFPSVSVHQMALGDETTEATFHRVLSSPALSGLNGRSERLRGERVDTVRVRVQRLDDVVPDDVTYRFVKVDVAGAELQVLRGATALLQRCRPFVVFEHGIGGADYFETAPDSVYDLLVGECGLQISLMSSWLGGGPPLDRRAFVEQFTRGLNYYFLAHPKERV